MNNGKYVYPFLKDKINWYPGHMRKATLKIENEISRISLFVEVIDARMPLSSRNPAVDTYVPKKVKRLLVLNKADLASEESTKKFVDYYKKKRLNVIALTAKDTTGNNAKKFISKLKSIAKPEFKSVGAWLMIGGIPNVGKSTLINSLRKLTRSHEGKTNTAKVGPNPGVTRCLTGFKVSHIPLVYMIDTPGIMPMKIESNEIGYKLNVCNCLRDGIIEIYHICDYLLWILNQKKVLDYVEKYNLKEPTYDVEKVIEAVQKRFSKKQVIDAGTLMLDHFREGSLGKITFDNVPEI